MDATSMPQTLFNTQEDLPGPRCGHTLTAVYQRLILFGGFTSVPKVGSDNSLQCLTNSVYCLNALTKKWTRVYPEGEPPSPRTNHAAVSCGHGVLIQGGIGSSGICNGDLHVLDMSGETFKWKKVVVEEGMAPGPRYGHVMGFAGNKLVIFGGKNVLDTSTGEWVDTSNEIMRRSLHAAASIGSGIYVYGGLREGLLLGDLLISGEVLTSGQPIPSILWRSPEAPSPPASDMNNRYQPNFSREKLQDLVNKVISTLLRPQTWEPPVDRKFFLSFPEVAELCFAAKQIIEQEPTVLQLNAPIKVFGDLHGQFGDLMRLFYEYGYPSRQGDISCAYVSFVQVKYPKNIHLISGNHEAEATNKVYGFLDECVERIDWNDGNRAFKLINDFFSHLPLAALIEKKIFCVHGGIGSSVFTVEQIANIKRPVDMDCEYNYKVVKDLLWSDPTAHDSILGIGMNKRGPNIVSFGPDRVYAFCERNDIDLIIRGHECVLDGFERFAQGKLITVFSATNYCGILKNAGAILVIGRNLDVIPKLIHPLPPPISPSENLTDKAWIEVDNERSSTPIREQPNPDFDQQGSTS
ncbi:hypothetical protein Bca52824_011122 [Brassica carinata]|uniref:Serine/threonine specific protein phosphatases domain-containing protein n=1 Tax=Brassica carinata TaxID=52824 RepID=A0A8X7WCX2_BRACI|nr:hypothetical protein Bca52824_011122 [Brassica carinata]